MKTFKKIITVICIFAMLLNITAFAANGYKVEYNDDATEVTVSVSQTVNEEIDILTNTTLNVKSSAVFPTTTSTGTTIKQFGSWTKGAVCANNGAQSGQIGYYSLPSAKAFQEALQGDIEDYDLVVTFTKGSSNTYIEDIEIGLGNAAGTSGYASLPTVVKTYPLGNFGYGPAANSTEWTLTVSVSDILESGNETLFPGNGTPNTLTADNINLFAVKAKYCRASTATAVMLRFSSIKLVAQSGDDPLPESYSLINAFYDIDDNLVGGSFVSGAPTSLTSDVPSNANYLRSFIWADLDETLRPLRPSFEGVIPIKRSILFIGGRGAVDSSKELHTLAEKEGFDFDVDCVYNKGREIRDHWRGVCADYNDYELLKNGIVSGASSIEDALAIRDYDIIVLEQSSGYAGAEDTFFPYIDYLTEFINEKCPQATIYYNTLWPYPSDYTGTIFEFYDDDPEVMKNMINSVAQYLDDEADVEVINTNNIVYSLANTDGLSLYKQETDTNFYRLGTLGKAAVQSKILYDLTRSVPKATSITSVYSNVTTANANKIIGYLE